MIYALCIVGYLFSKTEYIIVPNGPTCRNELGGETYLFTKEQMDAIALQGISGPNNTGGPCVKSDGSFGFFTQLPDGTCWPIVTSGNITITFTVLRVA